MTKIAFVADVHTANHRRFGGTLVAGLNQRCRDVLSVLRGAYLRAIGDGAAAWVVVGDLVDTAWPEPQLLAAVQELFKNARVQGLEVILIVGNHDQHSTAGGDHALGVFQPYARIVDAPEAITIGDVELLCIPFRPGAASEWFEPALAKIAGKKAKPKVCRVLAVHLGISDEATPAYLRGAADSIDVGKLSAIMDKHGITRAFAGNWHEAIVWDDPPPVVQQIGALVPTGWDNPGLDGYGGFAVYDSETDTHAHVELPGPRFVHVRTVEEATKAAAAAALQHHKLYVKLTVHPDAITSAREWVTIEKAAGNIVAGEVIPDQAEAKAAARMTAIVTRSAETIEAALGEYVTAMPLPPEVPRSDVLDESRGYLARAGGRP